MATCNVICEMKIKCWVRPMIAMLKALAVVTRMVPDTDKLAGFIARRGIKKKFIIKDL